MDSKSDPLFLFIVLTLLLVSYPSTLGVTSTLLLNAHVTTTCVLNVTSASPSYEDRGGLSTMLKMAADARTTLELKNLPMKTLSEAFEQINGSLAEVPVAFHSAVYTAGVNMAAKALLSASFALVLGISMPLVFLVLMWVLPKICTPEEPDELEDDSPVEDDRQRLEEEKNSSIEAQLVVCLVVTGAVLSAVLLVVFLSISLTGNQWVSDGVRQSSRAAKTMLPELSRVEQDAISGLNRTLLDSLRRYDAYVMSNMNTSVSALVETEIKERLTSDSSQLLLKVDDALEILRSNLLPALNHATGNITSFLVYSNSLVRLRGSLRNLSIACGRVTPEGGGGGNLTQLCQTLMLDEASFAPTLPWQYIADLEGVKDTLSTQYLPPVQLLAAYSIPAKWSTDYKGVLEKKTWSNLYSVYKQHCKHVESLLWQLVGNMSTSYEKVNLHLPETKAIIDERFGPKYLASWEELRFGLCVILAVFVLFVVLCVVVCSCRGLLCVMELYRSGYDSGTALASNHSADTIRRLSYVLFGAFFLVGVSIFVTLPLAATLGSACGESSNFSELTDHFLDSPQVWNGGYPLGSLLLSNMSAPLTLSSMQNVCEMGGSLYEAYQLTGFYSFNHTNSLHEELIQLIRGFSSYSTPPPAILGANITRGIRSILTLPPMPDLRPIKEMRGLLLGNQSKTLMETYLLIGNFSKAVATDNQWSIQDQVHTAASVVKDTMQQLAALNNSTRLLDREVHNTIEDEIQGWGKYRQFQDDQLRIAADIQQAYNSSYHVRIVGMLLSALNNESNSYFNFLNSSSICSVGQCKSIAGLYHEFTGGACGDVLKGLDLLWSSQCAVLLTLIPFLAFSLIASRRFAYKKTSRDEHKVQLTELAFNQSLVILWYLLSASIAIWLVVSIMNNSDFHSQLCSNKSVSGCCPHCAWVFGLLFVSVCVVIAIPCYCYLCYLIHRIRECKFARTSKYWTRRYCAMSFYLLLFIFILQDLPSLIICFVYMGVIRRIELIGVLVVTMVIVDIVIFVTRTIRERKDLPHYWKWLRKEVELKSDWVRKCTTTPTPPPQPTPPADRHTHFTQGLEMTLFQTGAPPSSGAATPVPPYEHPTSLHPSYEDTPDLRPSHGSPPTLRPSHGSPSTLRPSHSSPPTLRQSNGLPPTLHLSSEDLPPPRQPVMSSASESSYDGPSLNRYQRPDSVLVLDQVLTSDHEAMMRRQWMGSEVRKQGGVYIAEPPPTFYGSSTIRSGSVSSVQWGSDSHSTCGTSQAHTQCTSGEEGVERWDGSRKLKIRKKRSFSGELTLDV